MKHYLMDTPGVLAEVKSTENGLSAQEAAKRLEANGKISLLRARKILFSSALSAS